MSAFLDYMKNGEVLLAYHIWGMAALVICAVCISMSNFLVVQDESTAVVAEAVESTTVPVYVPILVSFTMPTICSFFMLITKHVTNDLNMSSNDWTFGFFFAYSIVLQIGSIAYFCMQPDAWDSRAWIFGFFGSIINCLGQFFAMTAIATNAPIGPIVALLNT